MKVFFSLIKKEAMENIRTKKFLLVVILFLFIGLISPLTAKLTPLILQSITPENMDIKVMEVTEIDSWSQFFKNVNQIGMFGFVILFSTQIVNELQKGTLINLLSKGLPRFQIILSKFTFNMIMWSISYFLCAFTTFFYTKYFFENAFSMKRIFMAILLPFIFGIFLISLEILGSIITESVIGTLLFVSSTILIQFILSIKTEIVKYLPITLIEKPINLIKGIGFDDYFIPIFITSGLVFLSIALSIIVINRKQIY